MHPRFMLAVCAALTLAACATAPPGRPADLIPVAAGIADASLPPPAALADKTKLDEGAAIGFETAVAATADLATLAVRSGVVPASQLRRLGELSAQARVAVAAVRAAYDAGNAASYGAAINRAKVAIDAVRALARGEVR